MILINDFGSVTYENFHANHIHTRHLLLDTSKYDVVEIIIKEEEEGVYYLQCAFALY